jgi:hypothetical protein
VYRFSRALEKPVRILTVGFGTAGCSSHATLEKAVCSCPAALESPLKSIPIINFSVKYDRIGIRE